MEADLTAHVVYYISTFLFAWLFMGFVARCSESSENTQ